MRGQGKGVGKGGVGMGPEYGNLAGEFPGPPPVVGIEKGDEGRRDAAEAEVSPGGRASCMPGRGDATNSPIRLGQVTHHVYGCIRRSIVYHPQVPVSEGLLLNGSDRGLHKPFRVVGGDDDINLRHEHTRLNAAGEIGLAGPWGFSRSGRSEYPNVWMTSQPTGPLP